MNDHVIRIARQGLTGVLWAALAMAMVGCSATRKEIVQDQGVQTTRAVQAQQLLRQPTPRPEYLVHEVRPKFATRSVPVEPGLRLPPEFGNVVMRMPGRHSLSSIAELISRLIELPVVVTPDALLDPSEFMPVGIATAVASSSKAAATGGSASAQTQVRAGALGLTAVPQTDAELRTTYELNYRGSLAGLLDQLASKAGLQWRYQEGRIVLSRMVTRVLTVKALSGGVKTSNTMDIGAGMSGASTADSDFWAQLESNARNQISVMGKLQFDQRSGTVTVTDALANVEAVERLVQTQNNLMMRQVVLEVEVLQVNLQQEQMAGIDWTSVGTMLGATSLNVNSPSSLTSYSGKDSGTLTFSKAGGKMIISALEAYGKVNTAYSAVVTTTNRQPVPVGVINNQGYLKQVTAGTVSSSGATTGATLTAGTVTTGLSLVVTPTVLDSGQVLLESALSISALREMATISSGVGALANVIQAPNVDQFTSLQRVTVRAGDTLVMTGIEREILMRDDTDVVRGVIPGSQRSQSVRQSTVILITPRLSPR